MMLIRMGVVRLFFWNLFIAGLHTSWSFSLLGPHRYHQKSPHSISSTAVQSAAEDEFDEVDVVEVYVDDDDDDAVQTVDQIKSDLVRVCCQKPTASVEEVRNLVQALELIAEQEGVGQASSTSGLLSGEWELLYASEDETRSSPFFWAFRKAFPDSSDQIFGITDSIPAPVKEAGPAFQVIDLNSATQTGRFVSRVKVATLGGMATSIMTTRASIIGIEGTDGIRLKIETTKPEESTIVNKLFGPALGSVVNENAPPFPSGAALELVQPGSSEVIMRTTFCDEGLRISRNDERMDDFFVWRRRKFASFDFL